MNDPTDTEETDDAVWRDEVRDVTPLDEEKIKIDNKELKNKQKIIKKTNRFVQNSSSNSVQNSTDHTVFSNDIDARTLQKLKRGQIIVEARLDLHGMSRAQAYDALYPFITRAQTSGKRCVLVITGKGKKNHRYEGVLRQALPKWLSESRYHRLVLTHVPAHKRDGGGGAFYIYLRRDR